MQPPERHKHTKQHQAHPWGAGHKLLWPFVVFLLLMACFASSARAIADTGAVVTPDQSMTPLSGHLHWLRDISTSQTLSDILLLDNTGAFQKASSYPSFGYTRDTVWVRFSLTNDSNEDLTRWLNVAPAFLDHVQLYEIENDALQAETQRGAQTKNIIDHGVLGDHQPWSGRIIQSRFSVFPLLLPAGQSSTFYLKVSSSSSIAIEATLWAPSTYANVSSRDAMLYGTLITALSLLALLSLLFAALLKRKLFLHYFFYALSFAGTLAIFEGVVHLVVKPDESLQLEMLQVILQALTLISLTSLFATAVNTKTHLPRFSRTLSISSITYAIASFIPMLSGNIHISISMLWLGIAALYFLIPCVTFSLRNKVGKSALIYSAAFAVFALSASIRFIWVFGLSGPNILSENIAVIGVAIHMVILYIAIATRYVEVEKEMHLATDIALHTARKYNSELEAEVSQRTKELDEINQQLAAQLASSEQSMAILEKTRVRLTTALDAEKHSTLEQRRFLRMVAHEFRTPLAVIQTAAEMIEGNATLDDSLREQNCRRIQLASGRMASLVDQALKEDKIDSAIWRKNAAWISANDLIVQSISHGDMLSAGRHQITRSLCPDHFIQGDRDLLITLLNNIIENAVKYSPVGTEISVSTDVDSDLRLHIFIRDHGRGMSPEEQRQMLDKYFRADNTDDIAGMGLGLYLADQIAQLHDATLRIESILGQGTQVQISFNARPVQEAIA